MWDSTPRRIPPEFWDGYYAKSKKRRVGWCLIMAVIAIGLGSLTLLGILPVEFDFIFELGVLISGILIVSSLWELFSLYVLRKPFKIFEKGESVAVSIEEICLAPTSYNNGQAIGYAFCAKCKAIDQNGDLPNDSPPNDSPPNDSPPNDSPPNDSPPNKNLPREFDCRSDELSVTEKDLYMSTLRVGDIDTVLFIPKRSIFGRKKKLKPHLFAFLGLQPGYGIVDVGKRGYGSRLFFFLDIAVLVGFFGPVLWTLYAIERFAPIESTSWDWPLGILGGIVFGGGTLGYVLIRMRQEANEKGRMVEIAIQEGRPIEIPAGRNRVMDFMVVAVSLVMAGGLAWVLIFSLNALFDWSKPTMEPVEIVSVEEKAQTVTFCFPKVAGRGDFEFVRHVAPGKIKQLRENGMAEVRQGAFGWEWVKTIHPVPGKKKPVNKLD